MNIGKGMQYSIRQAKCGDMASLLPLALAETWNDSVGYLESCFNHYPAGYFVAVDSQGELIGHCGANPCDDDNGYINLYVTKKAYRGMGIGRQLYEKSLQSLGNRNIALNANWDRQDMYKKAGFMISSFKLHVYNCPMKSVKIDPAAEDLISPSAMVSIKNIDFKMIYEYDVKINPTKREEAIKHCLQRSHFGLAIVKDGKVEGWGTLSKGDLGYALSPVYADTGDVAKALIYALLKKVPEDGNIEVAFPAPNAEAQKIFDEFNITSGLSDHNMRMYSKRDVVLPLQLLYSPIKYHTVLF